MAEEVSAMPERITVTVAADRLPEEVRAQLREHPLPGTRYRMTVEAIEETDEEKRTALRQALSESRAQVAAGQVVDGDEMFGRLRRELFPEGKG